LGSTHSRQRLAAFDSHNPSRCRRSERVDVASLVSPPARRQVGRARVLLQPSNGDISSKGDGNPRALIPLTGAGGAPEWPWPDDLDAMIAAPEFHTVLFEDDRVRVLDGRVPPGATVPVHTHRWGAVLYILATSDSSAGIPMGTCSPIPGRRNPRRSWVQRAGRTIDAALPGERRRRGVPHAHRGDERREWETSCLNDGRCF
jgi:hypothetical protein